MSESGIFIKILPQLELAALASVITQMKNILSKAGPEMSASMAASKREIVALQDQVIASANKAAQAQIRANKLAGDSAVQEAKRGATADAARQKSIEDRSAAEIAAINAVDNAHAKKAQSAKEAEQADAKAAQTSKDLTEAQAGMASQSAMTGGAFGAMGGAAAAAFGVLSGVSLDAATKFETSMARLQVAGQVPVDQLKAIQDGLLQMSAAMGEPLDKLSEASLMLAKSGPQYKEAANNLLILKSAIELSKTEGADLTTTVQQMTTIMTDFSMSTDQAANVAAKLQVAASNAKRPLEEYLGALHNIEPTAALMMNKGTGPDELLGAMGQMAQFGASMDDVTNNMNNFLQHLGNPSGPQRQALGLLNIDSNKLAEDLKKPNGLITVLGELHDAMAKLPHTGSGENVKYQLGTAFKNPQTTKLMNDDLAQLSPAERALADRIMASEQSGGVISADDARESRRIQGQGGVFADWIKKWKQTSGVNGLAAAGIDPNNLPLEMLYGMLGGSYASDRSMFGLMGDPTDQNDPHWKNSQKVMGVTVPSAKPAANGDLPGWDVFKGTNKQKIDELKGQMEKLTVSIGTTLLPAAKHVVDALNWLFDALTKFKPVLTFVTDALAVMTLRWMALKTAMAFGSTFTSLSTGFKTVAKDADAASLAAGGIGGATKTAAKDAENAATSTAGSLGKVGKEADNTVGKIGKIGEKLKFLGSMVWPVAIGLTIYDIASSLADATDATPDLHQKLVHDQGARGRFSPPGRHSKGGMNYPSDVDASADRRGLRGGGPDGDGRDSISVPDTSSSDSSPTTTVPGWAGPGGDSGASNVPTGASTDPVTVSLPQSELDQIGKLNTGTASNSNADNPDDSDTTFGDVKGAKGSVFNPLKELRHGGLGLSSIAEIMTKFLVNLALGNPIGHLEAGTPMFGGDKAAPGAAPSGGPSDAQAEISRIAGMTNQQRKNELNQRAINQAHTAWEDAKRKYQDAMARFGPTDYRTKDADDKMVEAADNVSTVMENQVSALQTASDVLMGAQSRVDADLKNGINKSDPGKYSSDVAARDKALNQIPDGAKIAGVEIHSAADAAKASAVAAKASADAAKATADALEKERQSQWYYDPNASYNGGATGGTGTRNLPQSLLGGNYAPLVGPGGPGTSPNGFPLLAPEQSFSVNGVSAQDAAGGPAQRLQQFAQWFNDAIEPVKQLAGFDAGGHGLGNASNHTSGTALDINWDDFTALQGHGADANTHFSPLQMQAISQKLTQMGMTWGQYWSPDSRDPGHFELGGAPYDQGPKNIGSAPVPAGMPDGYTDPSTWGVSRGGGLSGPGGSGGGMFGPGGAGPSLPSAVSYPTMFGPGAAGPSAASLPKSSGSSLIGPGGSNAAKTAASPTPSNQATHSDPGTGAGGIGAGTGIQGTAEGLLNSAVGMAVNGLAPGAGMAASMGMQIGEQELNNVANYIGKIAGVGVDAVFETFGVSDPDGGQTGPKGGQNWLTKVFGGLAGGHPQSQNSAGGTQPPVKPSDPSANPQGGGDSSGQPGYNITNNINTSDNPTAITNKINQGMMQYPTGPAG